MTASGAQLPEEEPSGSEPPKPSAPAGKADSRTRLMVGVGAAIAVIGLMAVGTFVGGRPSSKPDPEKVETVVTRLERPEPPNESFVGSAVCAECHAAIAKRYATHPMAHSLFVATEAPALEDYEDRVRFSPTPQREYWVERRTDAIVHHEIGKNAKGEPFYDDSTPVAFAMGSGQRGRSYLLSRDGYLFMSPISWYTAGKRWDLSPQYDPVHHARFERPVADRCLQCHVGRVNYARTPTTGLAQRYADPPFHELTIGCERCHGPGGEHVEFRRRRAASGGGAAASGTDRERDPIVNPAKLDAAHADAVCNQCHLQGESIVLRYGRRHGDFRPGQLLGDIWTIFVGDTGVDEDDETRAVSQVEQMHVSRCYERSSPKLGCSSCHDAHDVPASQDKGQFYEAKCLKCHSEKGCALPESRRKADPAKSDCISCHMPRLRAADVPHTAQTDHRILRMPAKPSKSKEAAAPETRIFDLKERPLSPAELDRAWGIHLSQRAEMARSQEDATEAEKRLERARLAAPDDVDVLDALALAYVLTGKSSQANATWRSALVLEPDRQNVLFSLALLLQRGGEPRLASVYLGKLLEVNPWQADVVLRHAQILKGLGKGREALESAERSRTLNPSNPNVYSLLRDLYRAKGDDAAVQRFDELIRQLPPAEAGSSAR